MKNEFDIVVIGAGHAGCEAANAAARMGKRVLLTCTDIGTVAYMACNPSIGGAGKSQLVYEIDAMGGVMGRMADKCCIQMRILNRTNGPAVQALRAQIDRHEYHESMLAHIQSTPNITLCECEVTDIYTNETAQKVTDTDTNKTLDDTDKTPDNTQESGTAAESTAVTAVRLSTGEKIICKKVIVASGVYLNSKILVGHETKNEGPAGFRRSENLTASLIKHGIAIRRFNTNTPPRIISSTIDYKKTTVQPGDSTDTFSFTTADTPRNAIECHLTHTNEDTHKIIRANVTLSATYGGKVSGPGPRYCPSIEDKIVRFPQVQRHQIFLEPESLRTHDVYIQGLFTSLPRGVQEEIVHSVAGLEHAEISAEAYGIEYDCIDSTELYPTLEHKKIEGLYFAGQVNGTSGYEEAAAQGILAGINAASARQIILPRTQSYIGVLVDDLVTEGTNEPYRMFTSRAEHRLFLRKDNADSRLTPLAREIGLIGDERWKAFCDKQELLKQAREGKATKPLPDKIREIIETENLYAGYLARESKRIEEVIRCEKSPLPRDFDYQTIVGLRKESQTKLNQIKPQTIAQARRISGVTPADINILLIWFKKNKINPRP